MGRVVRGGWGVAPDVEIEQATRSELATDLERRTLFFKFMVKWLAAHPEVTTSTSAADTPLGEFLTFLKDEKVELTPDQLKENREYIGRALRREMALKLEGHQAAVQVAVEGDVQLLDAAKLFDEAARFPDRSPIEALFVAAEQRAQAAAHAGEQAHAAETATVKD